MNKYIKIKNTVIAALCVTVILMAAGYVVLSIKLDTIRNEKSTFEIVIKKVKKVSSLKGGSKDPIGDVRISKSQMMVDMEFVLYEPHDEMTYEIIVQNRGTMDATITDVIATPDFNDLKIASSYDPLSLTISSIDGKILAPGEEATIKVSVIYNPTKDATLLGKHTVSGKIGVITKSLNSK